MNDQAVQPQQFGDLPPVKLKTTAVNSEMWDYLRFTDPGDEGHRIERPQYDRAQLRGGITHFGVGAFHRAHLAGYLDDLAASSASAWSVTGTGIMAHDERVAELLGAQDGVYLLVEREGSEADGTLLVRSRLIGSITSFLPAHHDPAPLLRNLTDEDTRIVSLTVTESGYPLANGSFVADDELAKDVRLDVPRTTFGLIVAGLDARRKAGLAPFTVMSCDNLPGNGHVARAAVVGAAHLRSAELGAWIERNGAFPNGMVDRITPATTDADRDYVLTHLGVRDSWPVVCEPFRQWALEDTFVLGRPEFEKAGVLITSDVVPYEHMKLRLLNGSHSALAYHGALAGIHYVHDAVKDRRIERFIRQLMKNEAAPTLACPAGIDLDDYQESLVQRFSNAAIGDTIARLCMDGTSKFPTFLVSSLEDQLRTGGPVRMLALAIAGWCRYLQGVADDGSAITISHDPYLAEAREAALKSISEPRAFLSYARALGTKVPASESFGIMFEEAMESLVTKGSLQTLDEWTTTHA